MSATEIAGWAGTLTGITLGLPQVLRLLRTGRVDGLSVTAWQAFLVVNLIWTAHGLRIGQAPQVLTSALSLCSTVPILCLTARERQRHVPAVLLPGLLVAGALICVDHLFGSAAFGTAAIIPAIVANAGQSLELIRSPRIGGVSPLFLTLAVLNQGLWLSWAIMVPDTGTMIVAAVTGTITVFNLTWWSLRTQRLRTLQGSRPGAEGPPSGDADLQADPAMGTAAGGSSQDGP